MTGYIAGIARGHNAGICLLKDGKVVFSIEEERLSRKKYDGGPYASIMKILEYTNKIDYLVISHTQSDDSRTDFSGDTVYQALARKMRLIEDESQVVEMHEQHHRNHAAIAFYKSGFKTATSVIVDGAGTFVQRQDGDVMWEVESIFDCSYPANFKDVYKHFAGRGPWKTESFEADGCEILIDERAGIVKTYEAVTQFCGWQPIEAGKTMGLFPYGKPDIAPQLFNQFGAKRDIVIPTYPNGSIINDGPYFELNDKKYTTKDINEYTSTLGQNPSQTELKVLDEMYKELNSEDVTLLDSRRNMAYNVQTETQQQVLKLILKAVQKTGNKNVVLSGGYGLNCVANYWYLDKLKPLGINLYVEPMSNDAGTAMGVAMYQYHLISSDKTVREPLETLYLGLEYNYSINNIIEFTNKYDATVTENIEYSDVVKLLREKNIVTMFQGRSENGPRALGNRSILFDPTFKDGKDYVNGVKHREYFRPFAASVLEEKAKEWFDLKGMDSSPHMMYAVDCLDGVAEKVPSVIHIDNTCRIQTVNQFQNVHFYNLIREFHKETGVPMLFNTSFNLGGDPLVETMEDAFDTLSKSDIEYCYFPELKCMVRIRDNELK